MQHQAVPVSDIYLSKVTSHDIFISIDLDPDLDPVQTINWAENLLGRNLGKIDIRYRHCLMLHLKLEIFSMGDHITVHCLILLIYCFTEDSSYWQESINIRSQVRSDENILVINLGNIEILDSHCLMFHLKLEVLNLGSHIIVHRLIPLNVTCWVPRATCQLTWLSSFDKLAPLMGKRCCKEVLGLEHQNFQSFRICFCDDGIFSMKDAE